MQADSITPAPVETTAEAANAAAPKTKRDLQRGALRDLVELAGQCSAEETRMEQQHTEVQADADAKEKNGLSDLGSTFKQVQQQIAEKYQERQTHVEAKCQAELSSANASEETTLSRARGEYEQIQEEMKRQFEQAVWLADSLLDGEEGRVRDVLRKAKEKNAADVALLDGKRAEGRALLDRYNITVELAPPAPNVPEADEAGSQDAQKQYEEHVKAVDAYIAALEEMSLPKLFVGVRPHLVLIGAMLAGAAAGQLLTGGSSLMYTNILVFAAAAGVVSGLLLFVLRNLARRRVGDTYRPLNGSLAKAYRAAQDIMDQAVMAHDMDQAKARRTHKSELQATRDKAIPILEKAKTARDQTVAAAQAEFKQRSGQSEQQRDQSKQDADQWRVKATADLTNKYERELQKVKARAEARRMEARDDYRAARANLEAKWKDGLHNIQAPMGEKLAYPAWNDAVWQSWSPPATFPATVRFGELDVDVKKIVTEAAGEHAFTLPLPERFTVPALLAFPRQGSLLIHADRAGKADAIRALQMMMSRLLTTMPPGRVRFTLLDPVGLGQNFAGFMHLADYDESLVGVRIWTDGEHIDQRLANLTEHMETVIQKYLRNEFETIDDYNTQAGELAEPYRYLVIADLPVNMSDESFRRLSSIATTGARCGVYTLIFRDTRVPIPPGAHLDDLEAHSINLLWDRDQGRFVWRDEVFSQFPLTLDSPPEEQDLNRILHTVGRRARESNRVEVPFDSIAPKPEQFWTRSAAGDLQVPIGRTGATRLQSFRLGKGVAQHALVAGKTGSGKSTLLHALVSNLAMWYSPNEIELYLIDFKKGVEFKTYATHSLPHARAIAVESDREFGLSVLQRIDGELSRRGEIFRKLGVQDLASYREVSAVTMPRTLLVIDEFQEFFSEDDKLAQDVALLLDRLVRQGRAFGIHVLLGSQTIGGSSGLSRSTIGQIAVRIALQTSEADSQLILGDGNSAARLLSRPGEAIYNDAGGLVEGNSPFQVAWLPDEQREGYLEAVLGKARREHVHTEPAIVFEGNAPADIRKNQKLMALLDAPAWPATTPSAPLAWLGDPVAIKDPTSVSFRRQSGANLIIIGQAEEQALALMSAALVSLAAQVPAGAANFYILDGSAADSLSYGVLGRVAAATGQKTTVVEYRAVTEAMNELAGELARRQEGEATHPPPVFMLIFGLQRYRALRKSEESFNFSSSDQPKAADPGKQFADLIREGPGLGMHVMAWIDTATAIDRSLDRGSMREFDHRLLFQMSAADSSNIIDSPAANKLGLFRALAYSEEQGTLEKFRPYAAPTKQWIEELKAKFAAKRPG